MSLQRLFLLGFICLYSLIGYCKDSHGLDIKLILDWNMDWSRTHEGYPMGVPQDFSWALRPRLEAGNQPGDFSATTGWGHVFWSKDTIGNPGPLQIRNFQTYLCHGPDRRWESIQAGNIEGAEYQADFKNNTAQPAPVFTTQNGVATIVFDAGKTFHFWPAKGRARLLDKQICGFLVLLEARALGLANGNQLRSGSYLIGLGADYWIDMNSAWNNFQTNKGVGLGRLKYVGTNWSWYGMSTASDEDLKRLFDSRIIDYSRP